MSYFLPEGSKLFMSTGFAAAKTITTLSNASPAVAGSVAHGYVDDDELLVTSGWEDATDNIWRADQLTVDTFALKGLDATDTNWFPAGSGAGQAQKVSGWLELQQWLDVQPNGGDVRLANVEPIAKRNAIAIPAGFNATSINLVFGHDISLASQQALIAASRSLQKRAFKAVIAGGMVGYFYGYVSMNEMPQIQRGQVLRVTASVAVLGRFISY
ncbi:MAG: hypothetical protein J0M00_20145 [Burkholderiales bacterium]|nr:hypothetical protein [Burkholderiales bacterium]